MRELARAAPSASAADLAQPNSGRMRVPAMMFSAPSRLA
jgi:hypothetical protein